MAETITHTVEYAYHAHGGRRWAQGVGAQSLPRRALQSLIPHTADLDIVNAVFCIVSQLITRLDIQEGTSFDEEIRLLHEIDQHRSEVIERELQMSHANGKKLLCSMLGGAGLPPALTSCPFAHKLRRLARFLRWVACSCITDTYESVAQRDDKWAEATTFALWWQRCEDYILKSWCSWMTERSVPSHLSLHFDGIRVDKPWVLKSFDNVGSLCDAASENIERITGFRVSIVEKTHQSFFEMFSGRTHGALMTDMGDTLLQNGNCILAALWHFRRDLDCNPRDIAEAVNMENSSALARGCRTYRSCFTSCRTTWMPHMGFHPLHSGMYLLHAEDKGRPHCVAVRVNLDVKPGCADLYMGEKTYTMPISDVLDAVAGCSDRKLIVSFEVAKMGMDLHSHYEDIEGFGDLNALSDLLAGASCSGLEDLYAMEDALSPVELPEMESDPEVGDMEVGESIGEDQVAIREDCLRGLEREVRGYRCTVFQSYPASKPKTGTSVSPPIRCDLCPFRSFCRVSDLLDHIDRDHCRERFYVPAGRKMLNVVYALFDEDQINRIRCTSYIARAAALLRSTVWPALSCRQADVDRSLILVLTERGPEYRNGCVVHHESVLRRVGYTYYDRSFCTMVVQEFLLQHGRVRSTIPRVILRMRLQGGELTTLIPCNVSTWLKILEDVFHNAWVRSVMEDCLETCYDNSEFRHLSMDATIRVLRRVRGQSDYRAGPQTRSTSAIPDSQAKRRILTVLGRTSAVLGSFVVKDESSNCIADAIERHWPRRFRDQVRSVASDQPSSALYMSLKRVLPGLQTLSLDPVHIAMVYEHCFFRKRTQGSKALRLLMSKFAKSDPTATGATWGPTYRGCEALPEPTALEQKYHDWVLSHGMPTSLASRIMEEIDPETPWVAPVNFVRAMAALSSLHRDELGRRSHVAGVQLRKLLWNTTCRSRMEWYFNGLRLLHDLPVRQRPLLSTGTTANEAYHAEINNWMRNQGEAI